VDVTVYDPGDSPARIAYNLPVDGDLMDFWESAVSFMLSDQNNALDADTHRAMGVIKEQLGGHPDY